MKKEILLVVALTALMMLGGCTSDVKRASTGFSPVALGTIGNRIQFNIFRDSTSGTTYYYRPGSSPSVPMIVTLQGSGCNSAYSRDEQGNVFGGLHTDAASHLGTRVSILTVEKPHVNMFFQNTGGSAQGCSEEFKRDYTRAQWSLILKTIVRGIIASYSLSPRHIIIAGHSEGGEMAAILASEMPEVTHVLMAGGGGPIQLSEFIHFAKLQANGDHIRETKAVMEALAGWQSMARHPMAISPLYMGHPARYWTTFKTSSPIENLRKSQAKVYIIQGTTDSASPVESADQLAAELTVEGREYVYDRVTGGDHGLTVNGEQRFNEIWAKAFDWAIR